jgi:hypothetical protein
MLMNRTSMVARRALVALASLPMLVAACTDESPTATGSAPSVSESLSPEFRSGSSSGVVSSGPFYLYDFGTATPFATETTFQADGFFYGIPDGSLGAINDGTGKGYTYYGAGCTRESSVNPVTGNVVNTCDEQGVFTMTAASLPGPLETAPKTVVFGPGAANAGGAPGWIFDHNYAGGGQVVPFSGDTLEISFNGSGGFHIEEIPYTDYLMPYHGEYWYEENSGPPSNPGATLPSGSPVDINPGSMDTSGVHTYYGGIGLAVGNPTSGFTSMGQIIQLYPPLTDYLATGMGGTGTHSGKNVGGAYGSMVIADENGNHLSNPPPAGSNAFMYVFYADTDPGAALDADGGGGDANPPFCQYYCLAAARAPYGDVIAAVAPRSFLGEPGLHDDRAATLAGLFKKYYQGAWTSPGTSGDPTEQTASGAFTALLEDENGGTPSVLYDSYSGQYLLAFVASKGGHQTLDNLGICIKTSTDLIHWFPSTGPTTGPDKGGPGCAAFYQTSPILDGGTTQYRTDLYTTLIGENGDPLTGGPAPLVFFQNYEPAGNQPDSGDFPMWSTAVLDSIPVHITRYY